MTTRRILASALLALGLAGLLVSPHLAFAQERSEAGIEALKFLDATAEKGGLSSGIKAEGFSSEDAVLGIIGNVINVVLGFVGVIFFIQMFYAGFRWMSSGGNEEVVTESRQTIKSAVIGVVVVFAAFIVTNFVLNQIASITKQSSQQAGTPISGELGTCEAVEEDGNCNDPNDLVQWPDLITEAQCQNLSVATCSPNYIWTAGGSMPLGSGLGICKYPQSIGECPDQTIWLEHFADITQNECQNLSPVSCSPNANYLWQPR